MKNYEVAIKKVVDEMIEDMGEEAWLKAFKATSWFGSNE